MSYDLLIKNSLALAYYPDSQILGVPFGDIIGGNNSTIHVYDVYNSEAVPFVANGLASSSTYGATIYPATFSSSVNIPANQQIKLNNVYNAFYLNHQDKTFTIEFWFSFKNSFNGSGYLNNLPVPNGTVWSASNQYFLNNQLDIFKIYTNSGSLIGKIYYDYNKNTFRFGFYDSAGTLNTYNAESYIPVRNLNTVFYIVACYENGKLKLSVNGDHGSPGYVQDFSLWTYYNALTPGYFSIDNNSIISPYSSTQFSLGSLAFYDYELTREHQRRRIVVGSHMDKPVSITKELESSIFDFHENKFHHHLNISINGDDFRKHFYKNNVIFDKTLGIKWNKVDPLSVSDFFPNTSASVTASGLQFYNSISGLQMSKFGKMFSRETYVTLSAQVTLTSGSADSFLFSIPNTVDNQGSIHLRIGREGVTLGSLPPYYSGSVAHDYFVNSFYNTFSNLPSSPNYETVYTTVSGSSTLALNTTYNVGVCFVNNQAYVALSDGNHTWSSTTLIPNFNINYNNSLIIGNSTASPVQNNSFIRNFAINNNYQQSFIGYDWSHSNFSGSIVGQLISRFHPNTGFAVSQIMHWVKNLELSHFNAGIKSSKINWDGMDNCLVQIYTPSGTWQTINRGQYIPWIYYNQANFDNLIRVVVPYEYTPELDNQSFNHLNVVLYRDTSMFSVDGKFKVVPLSDSSYPLSPTHMIKRNQMPIQMRDSNIGIKFTPDTYTGYSSSVNGYAMITPSSSISASAGIRSLDFWFKPNTIPSSSGVLVDDLNGNYIYMDSFGRLNMGGNAQLYVNGGQIATAGTYQTYLYQRYHLAVILPSNASSVYINGANQNHLDSQYGFINIWQGFIPSPYNRYLQFVGNNIQKIDFNNPNPEVWGLSGQNVYVNDVSASSIFAYKIG